MAKLQIIFTSSDNFVGRAIKYLTGEPYTHVALRLGDEVLHSSLKGVETTTWTEFKSTRKVEASLFVNPQPTEPSARFASIFAEYEGSGYDYRALLWLGARYAFKKYLGISIPKVNLWGITGMYTCTEFVTDVLDGEEDSLITPYQLYKRLSSNG